MLRVRGRKVEACGTHTNVYGMVNEKKERKNEKKEKFIVPSGA